MTDEADTLDRLLEKPLSPAEAELRGDLQLVHDELRAAQALTLRKLAFSLRKEPWSP